MQLSLIVVLVLLIGSAALTLVIDRRQRRLNLRVTKAMPRLQQTSIPSLRRQHIESRWRYLHRLINYRKGIVYDWSPKYMIVPANTTAAIIFYANSFVLDLPLYEITVIALVGAVIVVRFLLSWQQRQFSGRLVRQLPDAIQMVTSSVQAGLPVNAAFQTIAEKMSQPTAGQFAIICGEMEMGQPPEDALDGVYQRTGLAEYGMFAVTLAVQMKTGGRLTETLQTLGETVRQRVTLAARAKAMAGEVIFSARALSVAPFAIGGLFYWINPRIVDLLFTDPTGRFMLTYAICSVFLGIFVIYYMIRKETAI